MKTLGLWAGHLLPPIALIACIAPSFADGDHDVGGKENREIESVLVTATRHGALAQDISVAVSSISQDQIRIQNPGVLPEMLRGLPGTWFQQTTPGQGIPVIRGLKGSQILHLADGMRINNAFFRDAPNQYLGLLDAFAIDKVEVVRGASGSLYGADAMGGVVNFLTSEPLFEGNEWQSENHVYGSWNSADNGLSLHAQTSVGNAKHGFTAGISWQDHSDRRTGSGETVSPSGYRSEAANLKWTARLGVDAELMFSAQWLAQPSTPRTDELVAGFGQDHPASEQFAFQPNSRSFLHARYRSKSHLSWLDSFQVNIARQVIDDDRLTQDFGVPVVRTENNESTLDGLTVQLDKDFDSGTQLTWGLEFYADTVRSQRFQVDQHTAISTPVRTRFPDNSTMDSAAAYISAEWYPLDRWTLGAGLRYSSFDIHLSETTDSLATNLSPTDLTGDFRFVYELTSNLNLVGNLGRGFRPPNIFDLGTLGNRPGSRFNIANPSLQPESVHSYDLGLKAHTDHWQAELFLFYLDYRDKISSLATGQITETGRTVVRSENLSEASLYGLEAGFRWSPEAIGEVYGALNYTRGDEDVSGTESPADRIPPLNGKLGLLYNFSDRITIDSYLLFAGKQDRLSPRDIDDSRINPQGTPGWGTLNINVAWQISNELDLGLRLENLSDKAYREHASGIDAAGINLGFWISTVF